MFVWHVIGVAGRRCGTRSVGGTPLVWSAVCGWHLVGVARRRCGTQSVGGTPLVWHVDGVARGLWVARGWCGAQSVCGLSMYACSIMYTCHVQRADQSQRGDQADQSVKTVGSRLNRSESARTTPISSRRLDGNCEAAIVEE